MVLRRHVEMVREESVRVGCQSSAEEASRIMESKRIQCGKALSVVKVHANV